jgi:signal transduction histidine kinase
MAHPGRSLRRSDDGRHGGNGPATRVMTLEIARVEMSVSDRGCGMPDNKLTGVFEPF